MDQGRTSPGTGMLDCSGLVHYLLTSYRWVRTSKSPATFMSEVWGAKIGPPLKVVAVELSMW